MSYPSQAEENGPPVALRQAGRSVEEFVEVMMISLPVRQ
jgi:hypothetical protein